MPKNGATTKVTLKVPGFAQVRTGDAIMAELLRRGNLIANAAADGAKEAGFKHEDGTSHYGMAIDKGTGKGPHRRARVSVRTTTHEAVKAEATARVLTRAFEKAKG